MINVERIRELIDYYKCAHQDSRFKLTFLLLFFLIILWYFALYKQLVVACDFYDGQKVVLEVKKTRLFRVKKACDGLSAKIEHSEKELEMLMSALGVGRNSACEQAFYCFKKHHLAVKTCKKEEKEELAPLVLESFIVSVLGTFSALVACIRSLEDLYPSVICTSCEMKKANRECEAVLTIKSIDRNRGNALSNKKIRKGKDVATLDCKLAAAWSYSALRNPFIKAPRSHLYAYTGYGVILKTQHMFGIFAIDGISFKVTVGERIADHEVMSLSSQRITIKDPQGKIITIEYKKKPFNLDKLKG